MRSVPSILVLVSFLTSPARPVLGQGVTLVGSVSDSVSGAPIWNAEASLRGTQLLVFTDTTGVFRIRGLGTGSYVLEVDSWGFAPRTFRFTVGTQHRGEVRVGSIVLVELPPQIITIRGLIKDAKSGQPVGGAPIGLNGRPASFTDTDGHFEIRTFNAVGGRLNHLTMRRIGYAALDYDFWFADSATTVDLELAAEPLSTRLPDILVEGEMMILGGRRLAGFERRRKSGGGHFMTEKEIRKVDARATSEILRRIPGVIIRRTAIGTQVDLQASGKMCPTPVIYLDGTRVATDDVNMIVLPESLVGVEVYRSSAVVPPEFNVQNIALSSNCGVIAFWTR